MELECPTHFKNVIFLFHEGMLTNIEHSAILFYEETFGQTERSQRTAAAKLPAAPFLLRPSQEEGGPRTGGWRPAWSPPGCSGKGASAAAPAGRDTGTYTEITPFDGPLSSRGQMDRPARGAGMQVFQGGAQGSWALLGKLSGEARCWVLLSGTAAKERLQVVTGKWLCLRRRVCRIYFMAHHT